VSFRELDIAGFYSAADDRVGTFYRPLLERCTTYDRLTGYFRSSSLSLAGQAVSRLLRGQARVRLIVGAELSEDDLRAATDPTALADVVERALARGNLEPATIVERHRVETLAYLLVAGRLEIKVGVPVNAAGRPLAREATDRYFHSKYGVFADHGGDRVAFIGSDNESLAGWLHNHESFSAFCSWEDAVWPKHGQPIVDTFSAHWEGRPDQGWVVLDLPDAIAQRLVARAPAKAPSARDPAEEEADGAGRDAARERLRFVAAAPRVGGGTGVGIATSGIEPFPHQHAIAKRIVTTWPRSYLLADEVGLGKTIEAGLVLRELLASGRARTALCLVPASVIRQWQQELAEKFALDLPRYDGKRFLDSTGREVAWSGAGNPWRAFPVVLASSHLARRRDRRAQLVHGDPWDLVLVDEAHHARRRGTKIENPEPNALLRLLHDLRAADAWRALYLCSATPMQMHPHEAWDLLEVLGLPGLWGRDAMRFVRYFTHLRQDFDVRAWPFLSNMAQAYASDPDARRDDVLAAEIREAVGRGRARPIVRLGEQGITQAAAQGLKGNERACMDEWLRAHTPMRDRVFRTTRPTLRRYKAQGLISPEVNIPTRNVEDRFIPMTSAESDLYDRIETYIADHYNRYLSAGGQKQKALGFIMTVYRRRLTSSFHSIERSLRKRLRALEEGAQLADLLDEDDLAALETSPVLEGDLDVSVKELASEIHELRDFLGRLAERPPDESKMGYLLDELRDAFNGRHDTVLVFTQYTDTMDYVRSQLVGTYREGVGCYSGRGGERWDPRARAWRPLSKDEIKRLFRDGELRILIGTDSLSEGLNLQTCGKVVNYDMPWNFMRVEQRIGRIDRIGSRFAVVDVANYFYEGTVEEQIYRGIADDFEWFTDVVGPAQPVLAEIESLIEKVAMSKPGAGRASAVAEQVAALRSDLADAQSEPVTLRDFDHAEEPASGPEPAIDLAGLEAVLTSTTLTAKRFRPHPAIRGAWLLQLPGKHDEVAVTFRQDVLDEHAPAIRLLTYLTPELDALLVDALGEAPSEVALVDGGLDVRGAIVRSLADVDAALETS
jgi:hypothetical protein